MAAGLAGCNDSLDAIDPGYVKNIQNKTEHPLPNRILSQMKAKGMDRYSPIAIRIFKEEGVLEIWKAKSDGRFDRVAQYTICAWSGRLGPKVKEGDRQAPEGFYPLTRAHLNPYSKYFLAINTGFPNHFDAANGRSGSNLMIHGACSSSGCYSMTDAQILEIWAFARDAFKGGQQSIQLQAFPFRMTAENMARHRHSQHYDFWKMLKVGYDHFEVTKRPPAVNVCDRKYVFNQQSDGLFNPAAACPAMSTPPSLQMALASYNKTYEAAYGKALEKYENVAWYDPTEAERKALVAHQRKGHDLAFAPTGPALKAGKLVKLAEFDPTRPGGRSAKAKETPETAIAAAAPETPSAATADAASSPRQAVLADAATASAAADAPLTTSSVPVPVPNPHAQAMLTAASEAQTAAASQKTSRWKFWARQ